MKLSQLALVSKYKFKLTFEDSVINFFFSDCFDVFFFLNFVAIQAGILSDAKGIRIGAFDRTKIKQETDN